MYVLGIGFSPLFSESRGFITSPLNREGKNKGKVPTSVAKASDPDGKFRHALFFFFLFF